MAEPIARRAFDMADQQRFAQWSGDRNPMHLDPVAARRTQAGAPVVHGIHTLTWMLDETFQAHAAPGAVSKLRVRFEGTVKLGEEIGLFVEKFDPAGFQISASSGTGVVAKVAGAFGPRPPASTRDPNDAPPPRPLPDAPEVWDLDGLAGQGGRLMPASSGAALGSDYPAAREVLGEGALTFLAGLSSLVGMVCPGLHSMFGGLMLSFTQSYEAGAPWLAYRVASADSRFRLVRIEVEGPGVQGTVDAFARVPPAEQPSMAAVAARVGPSEFAGVRALVVGGSRGLGEITAKIVGAGGGEATLTYAAGHEDAQRVVQEIRSWGGQARCLSYDVRRDPAGQLPATDEPPTHLFYFATPAIFGGKAGMFLEPRLQEFLTFYVWGFQRLCAALRERRAEIAVFYPSSVAVETRPPGMTEYAMAKAAGEILCEDMNAQWRPMQVLVRRLPRLRTDQTSTMMQTNSEEPLDIMAPIVRDLLRPGSSPRSDS
jgi:hypothetical protein